MLSTFGRALYECLTIYPESINTSPSRMSNPKSRLRTIHGNGGPVPLLIIDDFGMRNGDDFRRRRADDLGLYLHLTIKYTMRETVSGRFHSIAK
jgi:hypothetical protein